VLVTKVGARRPEDGSWIPAMSPQELTAAVHDNLQNLGVDTLEVFNLRMMGGGAGHGPVEESRAEPLTALAELKSAGPDPSPRLEQCHARATSRGANHQRDRLRAEYV